MRVPRLLRRLLAATALTGPVGVLFGASSFAAIAPPRVIPSCSGLSRAPVVYRARGVVVYREAVRGDGGPHDWACPPHPASRLISATGLGTAFGGGFASGAVVDDIVSDGAWLADLVSSKRGWSSCEPTRSAQACRRDHHEVELTDVAGGGQVSAASGAHIRIHLSALPARNGHRIAAVAWTQPAKGSLITLKIITARDGNGTGAFGLNPPVTGKIDPRSVHLHGLTVSFTENGRHRTIKLGV